MSLASAAGLFLAPPPAAADCLKNRDNEVLCGRGACERDRHGEVACSAFRFGDALKTSDGRILCGRGACEKDSSGDVYCSSVEGGAVLLDSDGRVRCEGACEPASAALCEAIEAGASPDRGGLPRPLRPLGR